MSLFNLTVNGKNVEVDVDPNTPVLWVLRDHLKLVGTKYGCGMAQCGACTIHLNGNAVRSCVLPVSSVGNQAITTIEGLIVATSKTTLNKRSFFKASALAGGAPECNLFIHTAWKR